MMGLLLECECESWATGKRVACGLSGSAWATGAVAAKRSAASGRVQHPPARSGMETLQHLR